MIIAVCDWPSRKAAWLQQSDITLHRSAFLHKWSHFLGEGLWQDNEFPRKKGAWKFPECWVYLRKKNPLDQGHQLLLSINIENFSLEHWAWQDQGGFAGQERSPESEVSPWLTQRYETRRVPVLSWHWIGNYVLLVQLSPARSLLGRHWQVEEVVFKSKMRVEPAPAAISTTESVSWR